MTRGEERDRLRAKNLELAMWNETLNAEIGRLRAEVAKLRDALEQIQGWTQCYYTEKFIAELLPDSQRQE